MNESRGWPRPIPRPGKCVSITFGTPDDSLFIEENIRMLLQKDGRTNHERIISFHNESAPVSKKERDDKLRSDITAVIQDGMIRLGKRVSGEVKELKKGKI